MIKIDLWFQKAITSYVEELYEKALEDKFKKELGLKPEDCLEDNSNYYVSATAGHKSGKINVSLYVSETQYYESWDIYSSDVEVEIHTALRWFMDKDCPFKPWIELPPNED